MLIQKIGKTILFIILLLGAGYIFFAGWMQLRVGPNMAGIARTKTGGWHRRPITPGTFTWLWEAAIPGNLALYNYSLNPRQPIIEVDGSLPSGDLYSLYLPGNPQFAYSAAIGVHYRIRIDRIAHLAENEGTLPDQLENWYRINDLRIEAALVDEIHKLFRENGAARHGEIEQQILGRMENEFIDIEVVSVYVLRMNLPDTDLYKVAKESYLAIARQSEQGPEDSASNNSFQQTRLIAHINTLKQLGDILNDSPEIIEYIKLAQDNPELFDNIFPDITEQ